MSPILEQKLRFSDVAYAIGATPKALRNWLQRDQVTLAGDHSAGGWREFSYVDVALLALVRTLVGFGIRVDQANDLANKALGMFPTVLQYKNTPPGALALSWSNRSLVISTTNETWTLSVVDHWRFQSPASMATALNPSGASLVLNVEKILRDAFDRAAESHSDGITPDDDDKS